MLAPANPPSKGTDFFERGEGLVLGWNWHIVWTMAKAQYCGAGRLNLDSHTSFSSTAAVPQWQPHDTMHDSPDRGRVQSFRPRPFTPCLRRPFVTICLVVSSGCCFYLNDPIDRTLSERMEFHGFFYQSEMLSRISSLHAVLLTFWAPFLFADVVAPVPLHAAFSESAVCRSVRKNLRDVAQGLRGRVQRRNDKCIICLHTYSEHWRITIRLIFMWSLFLKLGVLPSFFFFCGSQRFFSWPSAGGCWLNSECRTCHIPSANGRKQWNPTFPQYLNEL